LLAGLILLANLVLLDINARKAGNHCFYVRAQQDNDLDPWDIRTRERVLFANQTVHSFREKTVNFVELVCQAQTARQITIVVSGF
jgi:hypothetical protein